MARNEYDDLLSNDTSYDGILQDEQNQKELAVKQNLNAAVRVNPEIYAKTRQLSSKTGLPQPLVERNLDEVETRAKVNEYDELIKGTKALKDNMTDQDFARLASDDLRSLVTLEEMLSTARKPAAPAIDMSQGFAAASQQLRKQQDTETERRILNRFISQGADMQTAQNILGGLKLGREQLIKQGAGPGVADYWFSQQVLTPIGQIKTSTYDFDTRQRYKGANPIVRGAVKGAYAIGEQALGFGQFVDDTFGNTEGNDMRAAARERIGGTVEAIGTPANPFDRNLEGAIGSIVSQAPGLAASVFTGSSVPALVSMFVQTASQEYDNGRQGGLSYEEATARAAIFGAAEVIGEKFGMADTIRGLRAAGAGVPTSQVAGYLARALIAEVPGEQLTTAIQFGTDALTELGLTPDATFEDYLQAVGDTLVQTLLQGGIMTGTGVAANQAARALGRRQEQAMQDVNTAELLNEVMAVASQSNLRARDTQSFAQLVQQAAELGDAAPNELYVPANVLQQALQQAQLDPGVLPSVASQIQDAALTNSDVVVPVGELSAAFSGSNIEAQLLDQSRFDVDGPTIAEQRQFLQEAQDKFSEEARVIAEKQAQIEDFEARAKTVYDTVLNDLNTAKRYSADVNNILADLVRNFYVITSGKVGTTPDALYQQFPLRVVGQSINTGQMLEQQSAKFAAWDEDRVNSLMSNYAYTMDDTKTKAYATRITPDAFIKLTTPADEASATAITESEIRKEAKKLNKAELKRQSQEIFLVVEESADGSWQVVGHEGRHRMAALQNAGVQSVPVSIRFYQGENRQYKDSVTLRKQKWARDLMGQEDATITDLIPINYANRQNILNMANGADVLFQEPLNQDQAPTRMMAVHNLSADNLIFADKMGGLAVPSIGVVTEKSGAVEGFGEITLIGRKQIADPAQERVFSADAYTARFPKPEWPKAKSKDAQKLVNEIRDIAVEFDQRSLVDETWDNMVNSPDASAVIDKWMGANPIRAMFLREKRIEAQPVMRTISQRTPVPADRLAELKPLYDAIDINKGGDVVDSPEWQALADAYSRIVKQTYKEQGRREGLADKLAEFSYAKYNGLEFDFKNASKQEVDPWATSNALSELIDPLAIEFKQWVEGKVLPNFDDPFIRIGAKKAPYTLDNIVKVMADPKVKGKEKTMTYGAGQVRAAASMEFSDIEQMREQAAKQIVDPADYEAARSQAEALLENYRTAVVEFTTVTNWRGEPDTWEALDASMRALAKWSTGKQRTAERLRAALKSENFNAADIPDAAIELGMQAGEALLNTPMPYFEAKPQRAVALDEFAGAVIPAKAPQEVRDILDKNGIAYTEYTDGNRNETVRKFAAELSQQGSDTLFQGENRGALGTFDPQNFIVTLNQGANLSTFLHEVGHFFLEVQASLAAQPNAPAQITQDMDTLLKWFGIDSVQTWKSMTLDQQRPYHEQFARGFEAYLFEGNAPNVEMQGVFQRFRAWLTSVYASLRNFVESYGVQLTPEVRNVMDRMLATDEQIAAAKERRAMVVMFTSAEESGMTDEDFAAYQQDNENGTQEAIDTMNKRSLADIKWLRRARSKAMRDFQKEGEAKRSEARIEARREILSQPVYQAWNFLISKEWGKVTKKEIKASKGVDPSRDSLFTAIAKLGGIDRAAAIAEWGIDPADIKGLQPVFGKPVFRKEGGESIDRMAENLSQYGYLSLDENGKHDLAEFEDMIMQELRGEPYYSYAYDYEADQFAEEAERDLAKQLPAGRLNLEIVKAMLGNNFDAVRPKIGRMLSSDGLHPDIVADLFRYAEGVEGFSSGRDLLNKLIEAMPPAQAIEQLTDQIVLERYGDITSEKAAQEAADEALHNEAMLRSAATEMKAIASMTGSVTAMTSAAKDAATRAIARVPIKDLRPNKYAAAAMRAGRDAETAIKKKDMEAAVAAKRTQLLNIAMTQQAYEAQANIRKAMQEFARLRRADKNLSKTHDINLVDTARSILSAFGVNGDAAIGNPILALEPLKRVQEYNPDLYAVLEPIATAAMIASQDARGNAVNYRSLTVEEFNGLRDTIRQLMHQARAEKQITVDGKRVDITEANAALIEQLDATGAKPTGAGVNKAVTDKERTKWTLSGLRAGLRRMEGWVDSQDLGNFNGAFRTYLFRSVSDGTTKYRTVKNDVLRRYVDMLQAKEKEGDFTDTKIDATEIGYTFDGKKELLGAMLHTGNESNKRKLLLGRNWGELTDMPDGSKVLNTAKWDAMIARLIKEGTLTKSDYDFLQATWDLMDSLKADAQQAHFYLYGYYFDEVTNQPFTTPFGEYRGGYAPAKADTELVPEAAIRAGVNEIEQDFNFLMPSTGNGFTKGRVNYNRPLVMDLRLVAQHIDQVLRFTYIQPAVSDTLKLVKRGEFANKLHTIDPQVTQSLILPWLSRAASQSATTPFTGADGKALQRFFTTLRRNTGMMIMTANFVNALQQLTGLSLTAVKVEPRYLKSAFARYLMSPNETANAAAEQSDWMRIRLEDQSFEMQKQLEQIMLGSDSISKGKDWIQRHAYFAQRAMQNMVDTISWAAAYDKAIAENMEEDAAVKYADGIVRQTQGSLLPEDISRFESGNAFMQLFTQFASYFNMQANLLGSSFANVMRTMGIKKGAGQMMYVYTMGFMIPAVMADAIVRTFGWDWDDEDDDGYVDEFMSWFFGAQARTALAMIPGVGQAGILFINRFNDNFYDDRLSTSPSIGAIENAAGAPLSAYKAIFEDGSAKKAIRDFLGLLSLVTGVPFSALSKPIGYSADYMQGKVEPVNPADAVRGLVSGKGREEERVN